jgi:hypothetical protein
MSIAERYRRAVNDRRDSYRRADTRDAGAFRRRAVTPRRAVDRMGDRAVATMVTLWGEAWQDRPTYDAPAPSLRIPRYVVAAGY